MIDRVAYIKHVRHCTCRPCQLVALDILKPLLVHIDEARAAAKQRRVAGQLCMATATGRHGKGPHVASAGAWSCVVADPSADARHYELWQGSYDYVMCCNVSTRKLPGALVAARSPRGTRLD